MPKDEYDNFYSQFAPTNFKAKQWARQAKLMGAKYMIITTKHHDGFCLWPSKYTNYTIANSPYKKDIIKELVEAYTAEDIDVYLYFLIVDWNHQGYTSQIPETQAERHKYELFKQFTRNQLIGLLTSYPQAKGLWFDGSWDKAWINEAEFCDNLETKLRILCPGLIIGSRFRAYENGRRHFDSNGDLLGDYEQGWERALPNNIDEVNNNDWDCVMTVPENQWGYHSDWKGYVKTPFDILKMIAKARSMNGNFGPDGKGSIRPEETYLATEIGNWMKINREAIYKCFHAGLKEQGWRYYTKRGDNIYMIVFNSPIDNMLRVDIMKDGKISESAYILKEKKVVNIINAGKDKFNNKLYNIEIRVEYKSEKPFVIVLKMSEKSNEKEKYQQAKI